MVTLDSAPTLQPTYRCGCIPAQRLCAEAVRLWRDTGAAYERSVKSRDFAEYEGACRAFDAHFGQQEAAPSQGCW
jgi:hypothetical protein